MKDTIYLICCKDKVEAMRKSMPVASRGQIVVKVVVEVKDKAFGTPTLEQKIVVDEWTKGIDLEDVELRQNIITKEEAEMIRQQRLEKMKQILKEQGYTVEKKENHD